MTKEEGMENFLLIIMYFHQELFHFSLTYSYAELQWDRELQSPMCLGEEKMRNIAFYHNYKWPTEIIKKNLYY